MSLPDACPDPSGVSLRQLLAGFTDQAGIPDRRVRGLQLDSRKIRDGDLFVALNGLHRHGLEYAGEAIAKGCAAILYEPPSPAATADPGGEVACIGVEGLAGRLGYIADRYYGHPSRSLSVLGITGTNGKTSCSHFLAEALGVSGKSAVVGTLGWGAPGQLRATTLTTPDATEIHRILHCLRADGFRTVAMEASSHGLVQGRLNGVRFTGALFTNFSRDHLDYHGSMTAYLDAKLSLLEWPELAFVVFNAADPIAEPILRRRRPDLRHIGFGSARCEGLAGVPLVSYADVSQTAEGMSFRVHYDGESAQVRVPVFGDFNVENITATLAVMLALGHPFAEAVAAVHRVRPVPGRMENVSLGGRTAVIDFAHTPDALASVLASVRRHCAGQLCLVFGCGGDRDRGKRAEMGRIAGQLADRVVLTDDNPRSEEGDDIIDDILQGMERTDIEIIRDRRAAIGHALETAGTADVVLIAGKGHESTQEIQGTKYPFNDREVAEGILNTILCGRRTDSMVPN